MVGISQRQKDNGFLLQFLVKKEKIKKKYLVCLQQKNERETSPKMREKATVKDESSVLKDSDMGKVKH